MTEEELRAKVNELTEQINTLTEENKNLSDVLKIKDETLTKNEIAINDLKLKNYELFMKTGTVVEKNENTETKQESNISLNDIIDKL